MSKIYELKTNSEEFLVFYQKNKRLEDNFVYKYWTPEWKEINLSTYEVINLELYKSNNGKKNYSTDVGIIYGKLIVFSEKALQVFKPFIENKGQILPITIQSKRKKYYGFYPSKNVKSLDIVNLELSDWNQAKEGKVFRSIILQNNEVKNDYLFSINEVNLGIYITDKFKDLVEKNDLKGFDFNKEIQIQK